MADSLRLRDPIILARHVSQLRPNGRYSGEIA